MAADEYRQMLIEAQGASSAAYDKAIMTLSGGALAISLTFIHDVAPHPKVDWLLQVSWGLLTLSLLVIVASFLMSEHAFWLAIEAHNAKKEHPSWWSTAVLVVNILAGASFVGGVAFFVSFALYNL